MKFEYNAINNPTFLGDRLLNKLGEEGWELVSHAYNSNTCDHFYTFKREKISLPKAIRNTEEVRKFKLEDSFKATLESAVVEDVPAMSWMDQYRGDYDKLLASGMFWEFHPTWTGEWDRDKYAFCYDKKGKKK